MRHLTFFHIHTQFNMLYVSIFHIDMLIYAMQIMHAQNTWNYLIQNISFFIYIVTSLFPLH